MAAITRAVGQSGRQYVVERALQENLGPLRRVYLASVGNQLYVLKGVSPNDFRYFQDMSSDLRLSPYIRVADDAIPSQSMFAYRYFKDHLLSFAQKDCIYALTKRVIFAVAEDELQEGEDELAIVIERQLSYFSDLESFSRSLDYLGDNPWAQVFTLLAESFNKEFSRKPFGLWKLDSDFKDLFGKMTVLGPRRRITAVQALAHPWFDDVDVD